MPYIRDFTVDIIAYHISIICLLVVFECLTQRLTPLKLNYIQPQDWNLTCLCAMAGCLWKKLWIGFLYWSCQHNLECWHPVLVLCTVHMKQYQEDVVCILQLMITWLSGDLAGNGSDCLQRGNFFSDDKFWYKKGVLISHQKFILTHLLLYYPSAMVMDTSLQQRK